MDLYSASSQTASALPLPVRRRWSLLISPQPAISQHCETSDTDYCITWCFCLLPSFRWVLTAPTHGGWFRLSWPAWVPGSAPRWFTCPKTVTHPGTNRVRPTRPTRYNWMHIRRLQQARVVSIFQWSKHTIDVGKIVGLSNSQCF